MRGQAACGDEKEGRKGRAGARGRKERSEEQVACGKGRERKGMGKVRLCVDGGGKNVED